MSPDTSAQNAGRVGLAERIAFARSEAAQVMQEIDSEGNNLRISVYRLAQVCLTLSTAAAELLHIDLGGSPDTVSGR
jgi:hypothetical protein